MRHGHDRTGRQRFLCTRLYAVPPHVHGGLGAPPSNGGRTPAKPSRFPDRVGLGFGLGFGLLSGLVYGGDACLSHAALRLLLWWSGALPLDCVRFVDYAAERILLRKVGGGYLFVHRLLWEHFATLPAAEEVVSSGRTQHKPSGVLTLVGQLRHGACRDRLAGGRPPAGGGRCPRRANPRRP